MKNIENKLEKIKNIQNKIHNCPNCTATSSSLEILDCSIDYHDARCCKCGMEYKMIPKYLSYETTPKVVSFIKSSKLTPKEMALKYSISEVDILAFMTNPTFYNLNMYKLASISLRVDIKEITSFILVSEDSYRSKSQKVGNYMDSCV